MILKDTKPVVKNTLHDVFIGIFLGLGSIAIIVIAILFLKNTQLGLRILNVWLKIVFAIRAVTALIALFSGKNQDNKKYALQLFLNIALFTLAINTHLIESFSLALFIALVLFLDGTVKIICGYLYKQAHLPNWWQEALFGLLSVILAAALLFSSRFSTVTLIRMVATYIIVLALSDLVGYIFQGNTWKTVRNEWKFQFLVIHNNLIKNSFLPANWFESIKSELENESDMRAFLDRQKVVKDIDLGEDKTITLLIHSWDEARQTMKGHVDIIIDGTAYSFGNYDTASHKFGGALSDGALIAAEEHAYYDYCLEEEGKVLFTYTLRVTNEQYQSATAFIAKMIQNTHPWVPTPESTEKPNAARKIQEQIGAKVYIFDKTQFRFYFVLDTNCVRFVQVMLKDIGFSEANIRGIVTPGDYIKYFEDKVNDPSDTTVIAREVRIRNYESLELAYTK